MASPAWFSAILAAFAPSARYNSLFAMSDNDLTRRGYDRKGLTRSYIIGQSGL